MQDMNGTYPCLLFDVEALALDAVSAFLGFGLERSILVEARLTSWAETKTLISISFT